MQYVTGHMAGYMVLVQPLSASGDMLRWQLCVCLYICVCLCAHFNPCVPCLHAWTSNCAKVLACVLHVYSQNVHMSVYLWVAVGCQIGWLEKANRRPGFP